MDLTVTRNRLARAVTALLATVVAPLTLVAVGATPVGATAVGGTAVVGAPPQTSAAVSSPAAGLPVAALPAPSGPYSVGVVDLHLVDRGRADRWVPERRRELMVSVWYPAASRRGVPDRYLTPEEARLLLKEAGTAGDLAEVLSAVRTHSVRDVRALPRQRGWPLIVLSPGFTLPRSSLTALAEDLASRGYVVAGIDHTYEAAAVTFPDGRVATCLVCTMLAEGQVTGEDVTASRAIDVSFVLDTLFGRGPGERRVDGAAVDGAAVDGTAVDGAAARAGIRIDRERIAMVGHSIGGASAAETMRLDDRIDAGINMDGTFFPPIQAMDRPFMMLGSEGHGEPGLDESWDTSWANLTGARHRITVTGSGHSSFTDYAILGALVGLPVQPLPGDRYVEITREYVAAFVGQYLRHRPSPLLAGASAAYPEVLFWP